jgi:pimeloyl-ACP methyl ester carboxylesterase
VYGDPTRIKPELIDRYFELTLRAGNRRAFVQRMQAWVPGEHAERIATLTQPTLIIWGSQDRLIPPTVGEEFERLIKGSQRVVLDGLGHVPQEEDPARSVAPVKVFLGLRQ